MKNRLIKVDIVDSTTYTANNGRVYEGYLNMDSVVSIDSSDPDYLIIYTTGRYATFAAEDIKSFTKRWNKLVNEKPNRKGKA